MGVTHLHHVFLFIVHLMRYPSITMSILLPSLLAISAVFASEPLTSVKSEPTPVVNVSKTRPRQPSKLVETATNFASGGVGVAFVYSGQPFDKIKKLVQAGEAKNISDAIRQLSRQSIAEVYAGATASLAAEVLVGVLSYAMFQAAKKELNQFSVSDPMTSFAAGGFAGAVVSVVYSPFDLIKIRLQTQKPGEVDPV